MPCLGGVATPCPSGKVKWPFTWLAFVPTEEQYVSDVLSYSGHGDPQVRGATAILCGTLVCSTLSRSRFQVGDWLGSVRARTGSGSF